MAAPTRDASGAGVAVLRQEAGGGRVVIAGVHVEQAGGIQGAAGESNFVKETYVSAFRNTSEFIIAITFLQRAICANNSSRTATHIVMVEAKAFCRCRIRIVKSRGCYDRAGGAKDVFR